MSKKKKKKMCVCTYSEEKKKIYIKKIYIYKIIYIYIVDNKMYLLNNSGTFKVRLEARKKTCFEKSCSGTKKNTSHYLAVTRSYFLCSLL